MVLWEPSPAEGVDSRLRREASSSVVCKFSRADGTEPQTVLRALEMSSVRAWRAASQSGC